MGRLLGRQVQLVCVAGVALLLAGCHGPADGFWSGPVAIRGQGDDFELSLCRYSTTVEEISVEARGDHGDWVTVWQASGGSDSLSRAERVGQLELVERFPDTSFEAFPANTRVVAVVIVTDDPRYQIAASFDTRLDDSDTDMWLHPDGTLTPEPCGA